MPTVSLLAEHLRGRPGAGVLVWQWTDRGFGSELITMLLGCLYAAERGMRFVLSSEHSNIACPDGWSDYFEPFCESIALDDLAWHGIHEVEGVEVDERSRALKARLGAALGEAPTLAREIFWDVCWHPSINRRRYVVAPLAIDGDSYLACRALLSMIWRPNRATAREIADLASAGLSHGRSYGAIHVRRGDKIDLEEDPVDPVRYLEKLRAAAPGVRDCFVVTDDASAIADLEAVASEIRFRSLVTDAERGYRQSEFNVLPPDVRRRKIVRLIANLTIASNADTFVGTFTSNLSKLVALRMGRERVIGVDIPFSVYHRIGVTRHEVAIPEPR